MKCNNQQLKSDRGTHTYVMGATARGKSAFLARLIASTPNFVLLDPTGELGQYLPAPHNPQPAPQSIRRIKKR